MEFDKAFRVSRERAESEVRNQGPLRTHIVSVEWASNVLEPMVRWLVSDWIGVRKRVRKGFSHYGALLATGMPGSGRDPGNRVYAVALLVAGRWLDPDSYWELGRRNQEGLGDLLESILGYAWWLKYRGNLQNLAEFEQLFRSEITLDWQREDIEGMWNALQEHYELERWVPWIEQLVLGAEALMTMLPQKFKLQSEYPEDYDSVRLSLTM